MHDRTLGLPLSFSLLAHYLCCILLLYHFFYSMLYDMNILEFHSMLYIQLLIPVILLTSNFLMFLCGDWYRTLAIILRGQLSTPRLQGAGERGIFVNPKR